MATYKVQKGDTLWKIAQQNNTTVAELAKANNIANPDLINIGQEIRLSSPSVPNDAVGDYAALLDTYKDRPDSAQPKIPAAAVPAKPATNDAVADYAALLDTYKDRPDAYREDPVADYQALLDTYKDRPDNSPQIVTGIKEKQEAMQPTPEPTAVDADPYYQAVTQFLEQSQGIAKTAAQATAQGTPYAAPQAFSYPYKAEIDSLIQQVLERPKFNYDIGNDPSYMALREQYQAGGNLAMRDAMGNAAALSGGYGNTYANTVGNQMYQQYLGKLNEQVPELYQRALDSYITEGNEIYKQIDSLNNANYYAQREFNTNYEIASNERAYQDAQVQQEYENALAMYKATAAESSSTAVKAVDYNKVVSFIQEASDIGQPDEYIASTVYNMYKDDPNFLDEGGLAETIMLPNGRTIAEILYELIMKGEVASEEASASAERKTIQSDIKKNKITSNLR